MSAIVGFPEILDSAFVWPAFRVLEEDGDTFSLITPLISQRSLRTTSRRCTNPAVSRGNASGPFDHLSLVRVCVNPAQSLVRFVDDVEHDSSRTAITSTPAFFARGIPHRFRRPPCRYSELHEPPFWFSLFSFRVVKLKDFFCEKIG